MSYPNPRTWNDDDFVPAPALNTEVRDSLRWLLGHSLNPFPHAVVRNTAPVALTSGQFSTIPFDTADISRGGLWASGSALIAPIAGMMCAGGCVEIETAACNKAVRLIVNAATIVAESDTSGVGSPAVGRINVSSFFHVDIGDFVELEAFQDLGVSINAANQTYSPVLWGFYVAVDD
jgi:hypothetical protein